MEVAAHVGELDERRRLAAERRLAQLGRAPGDAERRVDAGLVRRVRQRLERVDVVARARRSQELRAEGVRPGDDELHRDALDRDSDGAAGRALDDRDDRRETFERLEGLGRARRRDHDGEVEAGVGPPARIAGDRTSQPAGDLLHERTRPIEQEPAACPRSPAPEPLEDAGFRLRADARYRLEPTGERRRPELVGRPHVERAPDLEHSLRADAEQPPEADQLRLHLALELVELRDRARLDQLAEAGGYARSDPAELLHASGPDELGHRCLGLSHGLGRAPVRARRVAPGAGQVEEDGERLQALRDPGVVERSGGHAGTMPAEDRG